MGSMIQCGIPVFVRELNLFDKIISKGFRLQATKPIHTLLEDQLQPNV